MDYIKNFAEVFRVLLDGGHIISKKSAASGETERKLVTADNFCWGLISNEQMDDLHQVDLLDRKLTKLDEEGNFCTKYYLSHRREDC